MQISLAISLTSQLMRGGGGGPTLPRAFRAMGQGMTTDLKGFASTSAKARTTRSKRTTPVEIKRFRVVVPKFYSMIAGGPSRTLDVLFGSPDDVAQNAAGATARQTMWMQFAIEQSYADSRTGIATRIPVTFGGQNVVKYEYASWDGAWAYVSDIIELETAIPAGGSYGLWNTLETTTAAANIFPGNSWDSDWSDRRDGVVYHATAQISGASGNADPAINATTTTPWTSVQAGQAGAFSPAFLLVEADASVPNVAVWGDSTFVGTGEGSIGSGAYGDGAGDEHGNAGWVQRKLAAQGDVIWFNLSKGGERYSYLIDASPSWVSNANCRGRDWLLALAAPSSIIAGHGLNDFLNAGLSVGTRNNSAAVVKGACRKWTSASLTQIYYALNDGTTGGSTPLHGATVVDGTVNWKRVATADNQEDRYQTFMESTWSHWRELVPEVKIYPVTISFECTSIDGFATTAGQAPITGFGDQNSSSGKMNARFRAGATTQDGWLEGRTSEIETIFTVDGSGIATESGIYKVGTDYGTATLTAVPSASTSATLTAPWAGPSGVFSMGFDNGGTMIYRLVGLVNGSTAVGAPPGLSNTTAWTNLNGTTSGNSVTATTALVTIKEACKMVLDGIHGNSQGASLHASGTPAWSLP